MEHGPHQPCIPAKAGTQALASPPVLHRAPVTSARLVAAQTWVPASAGMHGVLGASNKLPARRSRRINTLILRVFQDFQRHLPAAGKTRPILGRSRRREARSAGEPKRRRERRERAVTERSGCGGPEAATPPGQGTGNNPRPIQETVVSVPARGARTGSPANNRRRPRRVENQPRGAFCLRRNGTHQFLIRARARALRQASHFRPGNSVVPKAARGHAQRRFSSQFRPDFLYVGGIGADRIRVLRTVRSRRLICRFHRP